MTGQQPHTAEQELKTDRLTYLEGLNQWLLEAFEAVASAEELHPSVQKDCNRNKILTSTYTQLQKFFVLDSMAFLTVDDNDNTFVIEKIEPQEALPLLQPEIEKLIDEGLFGWAVLQNRPVTIPARNNSQILILHSLATSTDVLGLFIGTVHDEKAIPNEAALNVMSILLFKAAVALEQLELYRRINDQNKLLEKKVIERTKALSDSLQRQKNIEEELRKAKDELEIRVAERTHELQDAVTQLHSELQERRRAEERIHEQAALLDEAQDAISVRSLDGDIRYWNKGAERIYGCTAEEVIGRNVKDLPLGNQESFADAMQNILHHGKWNGEIERQCPKSKKKVIVESRWTLVNDEAGQPKSILVIDSDITETKELELQFLRAQRMESIGTLAGGIAHDLNNVLTPILMWIEILRQKLTDQESMRMLELVEASARRGASMVKQVLSFSRGISGARVEVQMKHIVFELEKVIRDSFPKTIEIAFQTPSDLWTVTGDATQLHQVFLNLCVNARDAMPFGGLLKASCENINVDDNYARMHLDAKPGSYIVITVTDSGAGIPPETLERIFEPFFTTKEIGKGTGLGLSTSMAIVKSHNGFINVYSEVGHGTTFKVYLPASPGSLSADKVQEEPLIQGNNELVLIIDDEAIIREITKTTLERNGYRVLTADDGAWGIAVFTQHQREIRIVITDMMMPIMDGLATMRALYSIDPQIPIIGASGLADNERVVQARKLNIRGFLHKPYTTRELLNTLAQALNNPVYPEDQRSRKSVA